MYFRTAPGCCAQHNAYENQYHTEVRADIGNANNPRAQLKPEVALLILLGVPQLVRYHRHRRH